MFGPVGFVPLLALSPGPALVMERADRAYFLTRGTPAVDLLQGKMLYKLGVEDSSLSLIMNYPKIVYRRCIQLMQFFYALSFPCSILNLKVIIVLLSSCLFLKKKAVTFFIFM